MPIVDSRRKQHLSFKSVEVGVAAVIMKIHIWLLLFDFGGWPCRCLTCGLRFFVRVGDLYLDLC